MHFLWGLDDNDDDDDEEEEVLVPGVWYTSANFGGD